MQDKMANVHASQQEKVQLHGEPTFSNIDLVARVDT